MEDGNSIKMLFINHKISNALKSPNHSGNSCSWLFSRYKSWSFVNFLIDSGRNEIWLSDKPKYSRLTGAKNIYWTFMNKFIETCYSELANSSQSGWGFIWRFFKNILLNFFLNFLDGIFGLICLMLTLRMAHKSLTLKLNARIEEKSKKTF